jgi:hypothetical protein
MDLPPELLQAISSQGGGKIALVIGAGCSVEAPTSVPVSSVISEEIHRLLIADGVLHAGDCPNPTDLSLLADAVFTKTNSQGDVVERKANEGTLTESEEAELEAYINVGDLLAFWQSKARQALQRQA